MGAKHRSAEVAEALAGCSVKTLEKRGVDWKRCEKRDLLKWRARRSVKWLERLTGYTYQSSVEAIRGRVDWRVDSEEEIKAAINAHLAECERRKYERTHPIEHDGRRWTIDEFAALVDVTTYTLCSRLRRLGSWKIVAAASIANPGRWGNWAARGNTKGRPRDTYTIDGETRSLREWCAFLDLSRGGVWKSAKRNGRSTAEELTIRVRARRSDAAHAPASTAVASDQPPLVVSGDRAVSACVASGRGANDGKAVAA